MKQSDLTQPQTVSELIDSVDVASLIADILLVVAVFGLLSYFVSATEGLGSMTFISPHAPTEASWHPDSSSTAVLYTV